MPRRSKSRIAASEWQAGPMVQMILARRAPGDAGDEGEVSAVKEEFSVAGCGLLDFISSSTSPSLSSRAKRGILVPACITAFQGLQTETKIPRFAWDDNRNFRSARPSANSQPWDRSPQSVPFLAWRGGTAWR